MFSISHLHKEHVNLLFFYSLLLKHLNCFFQIDSTLDVRGVSPYFNSVHSVSELSV